MRRCRWWRRWPARRCRAGRRRGRTACRRRCGRRPSGRRRSRSRTSPRPRPPRRRCCRIPCPGGGRGRRAPCPGRRAGRRGSAPIPRRSPHRCPRRGGADRQVGAAVLVVVEGRQGVAVAVSRLGRPRDPPGVLGDLLRALPAAVDDVDGPGLGVSGDRGPGVGDRDAADAVAVEVRFGAGGAPRGHRPADKGRRTARQGQCGHQGQPEQPVRVRMSRPRFVKIL